MNIKEAKIELHNGVVPNSSYPNLQGDMTSEKLIALDPRAELEYRMAKDRKPNLTRSRLLEQWKAFNLVRLWNPAEGRT